jgi:hypothetical protein
MACSLTSGYVLDCKDSLGGIVDVMFIAAGDISSYTEASGVVTAITKAAGKKFYKYALVKGTSSFTENINASVENGTIFYQQELTMIINKLQVAVRNELLLLAKNYLVAIVHDANDAYWILGIKNGIDLTAGSGASGTAQGDRSGYTLTFMGKEPQLAQQVSSGIIAALLT